MKICFTGHRNKLSSNEQLANILNQFPDAVWVHGGAKGFDTQVEEFAQSNGIETQIVRPDYARYKRGAPIVRNKQMVDSANCVVACWDGRKSGGTYQTITYANRLNVPVQVVSAI